ncbi:MarR family winged helix-turn-helix transcriptional regulator [Gordonia terrae]|uniref:MarR family winged helix-turn-helix transcriptional regulator n=1 Tax=Gordonia terrae TaxID=2055 RepID=UPI00200A0FDF|nr:helix-turn-helix domain-containing protein [Gordonia terrae]UPW08622.1 MarR family winged helix-turn-helix transcriptional regulator [Gordonia terrae]
MNLSELRRLGRALSNAALASMHNAVDNSLTGTEIAILDCVRVQNGLTVGEIARRSGFAQSRVSNVVADLAARGLLTLAVDPGDRRRSLVSRTAAVDAVLADSSSLDAAPTLQSLFDGASDDDTTRLIAALEEAARVIEPHAEAYRRSTGGRTAR